MKLDVKYHAHVVTIIRRLKSLKERYICIEYTKSRCNNLGTI